MEIHPRFMFVPCASKRDILVSSEVVKEHKEGVSDARSRSCVCWCLTIPAQQTCGSRLELLGEALWTPTSPVAYGEVSPSHSGWVALHDLAGKVVLKRSRLKEIGSIKPYLFRARWNAE